MGRVVQVLEELARNSVLQALLTDEEVKVAIKHWTGEARLSQDEATRRLNQNPRVIKVMMELRTLTDACKEENIPVPFKAFLAGSSDPYYGMAPSDIPQKDEKRKEESSSKVETKLDPIPLVTSPLIEKETSVTDMENEPQVDKMKDFSMDKSLDDELSSSSFLDLTPRNIAIWWSIQIGLLAVLQTYL